MAKPGVMNLSEDEINFGKYLLIEKNDLFVKKQKLELSKIEYICHEEFFGMDVSSSCYWIYFPTTCCDIR